MSFAPTGSLYLLSNIPFDNKYEDVVNFADSSAQANYFLSKVSNTLDNYTYIRKDHSIRVAINIESLYSVNYVMYKNYTGSKWIYAFVKSRRYINDNNTEIEIETDIYQTWQFDVELLDSFVVREHVTDDTFGLHITDEGLDTGEYIRDGCTASGKLDSFKIMVAVSYDKDVNNSMGSMYAGVYSGLEYLPFDQSTEGVTELNTYIKTLADLGKSSMIAAIFMMPQDFISADPLMPMYYNITPTSKPITFGGYTPKNNKLYCYPYMCLFVSNNQGSGAVYRYEFMDNPTTPEFQIIGDMSPSPQVYLCPLNYKGLPNNTEEKLVLGNFPLCSWNNDVYANWLAQNKNRLMTSALTNVTTAIAGGMAGNAQVAVNGMM
jgi:hypothetical protein